MNLWLRLLGFLLTMGHRKAFAQPLETSSLRFRVWPFDLDVSMHMNNGRYLTLCDLGRLDVMARTGLWEHVVRNGWTPVVADLAIRYRRELKAWQRIRLDTRIVSWDESCAIFEHTVWIESGRRAGTLASIVIVRAGLYDPKARAYVTPKKLMALTGEELERPATEPALDATLAGLDTLREIGRGRQAGERGGTQPDD